MLGITDPLTYVAGATAIILLPGPNSLFALSVAAKRGVKAGFAAAAGIFTGDLILMLAAALGVASLMRAYPVAFDIVRYSGAAYLAWLGVKLLLARGNKPVESSALVDVPPGHIYRQAVSISLVNVKAIIFFMAFFPQFVDPSYSHIWLTFGALGITVQILSLSYLSFLILAGANIARRLSGRAWIATLLRKLTGMLFISFGARLALSR